jgi:hypothetical protein
VCGLADNVLFPAPNRKAALGSPHRTRHFLKQRRLQGYATANATAGYLKVIQAVRKMLRKGIYSLSSALAVGVLKSGQRVNGSVRYSSLNVRNEKIWVDWCHVAKIEQR